MKFGKQAFLGLAMGIFCILFAIMGAGELKSFWNLPSVFITVGGTLSAIVISFPLGRLKLLGAVLKKSFKKDDIDLRRDIETIVSISEITRREGLLSLEQDIDKYSNDEFLKKGLMLLVDGYDQKMIHSALATDIRATQRRHKQGYAMTDMIAATTPALGLLGTYVGLIPMLQNLNDPNLLGPLMAVELVSSFYGAFIAYIIFSPLSKRLKLMSADEIVRKELLLEGVLAIQDGANPRLIREILMNYLAKKEVLSMGDWKRGNAPSEDKKGSDKGKVVSIGKR